MSSDRVLTQFARDHPRECAEFLEDETAEEIAAFPHSLPPEILPGLSNCLSQPVANSFLAKCDDDELLEWMSAATPDEAARMSARLPSKRRNVLLEALREFDPHRQRFLARLDSFPSGSIGAVVDPEYAWIYTKARKREVLETLSLRPPSDDKPVVVVDEQDRLGGSHGSRGERGALHPAGAGHCWAEL